MRRCDAALWLFFAALVGAIARGYSRSFGGWFLLAAILSPLIAGIFILIAGPAKTKAPPTAPPSDPPANERSGQAQGGTGMIWGAGLAAVALAIYAAWPAEQNERTAQRIEAAAEWRAEQRRATQSDPSPDPQAQFINSFFATARVDTAAARMRSTLKSKALDQISLSAKQCTPTNRPVRCNYLLPSLFGISFQGKGMAEPVEQIVFSYSDLSDLADLPIMAGAIMMAVEPETTVGERAAQMNVIVEAILQRRDADISAASVNYAYRRNGVQGTITVTPLQFPAAPVPRLKPD